MRCRSWERVNSICAASNALPWNGWHRATSPDVPDSSGGYMLDADKSLIDCHVHLAALPDAGNGCYISPKMLRSPLFRFLLWKHGLSPDRPREANRKYLDDLLTELRASRRVRTAVLLGMDGVYDSAGRLDEQQTHFLIS